MAFNRCCLTPKVIDYSLYHDILPNYEIINLSKLLWYLPEIECFQSNHGTPFNEDIYEDIFIKMVMDILKLSDDDIFIDVSSSDHTIDDAIAKYYEDKMCVLCSKVVIAKMKGKNKIVSLFSHIRNMIAHGYFNVVEGTFIGFDHPKYGGLKYTGVIKVKLNLLNDLVDKFKNITNTASLFRYVLSSMDYKISDSVIDDSYMIEKDNRNYYLEFKKFTGRYINQLDLEAYISERRHIDKSNCTFVLVVDSTYTNSKINSFLVNQNICILDKKWVKELVQGQDVFLELTEAMSKFKI